jgi:hypothetical protein
MTLGQPAPVSMDTHSLAVLPGSLLTQPLAEESAFSGLSFNGVPTTPVLGQYIEDNLFSNFGGAFENFIESGQVWALLIGAILGYLVRGLTAF